MVLELSLVGGYRFELPLHNLHICFSSPFAIIWYLSPQFAILCHLSPGASIRPHMNKSIKEHDINIESKSYKFEFLGKLVIRYFCYYLVCFVLKIFNLGFNTNLLCQRKP